MAPKFSWAALHRSGRELKSGGVRKAMGYNMGSFTNSPVNGLLYVRGKIGAPGPAPLKTLQLRSSLSSACLTGGSSPGAQRCIYLYRHLTLDLLMELVGS